jgi:hypothetical protein
MEPDRASTSPHRAGRYAAVGTGLLLAGGLAYVALVDPHRPGSLFPPCPFHALTGWYCPGCGGLRMAHDLLHGDLAAAVVDNAFALVVIPALLAWVLLRRHRGRPVWPPAAVITVVVATAAWTVVRNLPGFPLVPTLLSG